MKVRIAWQPFVVRAAALALAALLAVGVRFNALLAADGTTAGWASAGAALAVETIDTVWTVTLQPVLYGNADTEEVPEWEFPSIY